VLPRLHTRREGESPKEFFSRQEICDTERNGPYITFAPDLASTEAIDQDQNIWLHRCLVRSDPRQGAGKKLVPSLKKICSPNLSENPFFAASSGEK